MKNNSSIDIVNSRKSFLSYKKSYEPALYPLYESYKTKYNFQNLRESVYNWNNYSSNVTDNVYKALELFDIIAKNGNEYQLQEVTDIFCNDIIPYIPSPNIFKKDIISRSKRLNEEYQQECLTSIQDKILEMVDCDRVAKNYDTVCKRFNLDRVIKNNINYDSLLTETIHTICSLIDTYDMNYKSKFCIAAESVLYGFNKYRDISDTKLLEGVIDYYLIHGGNKDVDKFLSETESAMMKDRFLTEDAKEYLQFLKNIYYDMINEQFFNESSHYAQTIDLINDSNVPMYEMINEENYNNLKSSLSISLVETAIQDKIKKQIAEFKLGKPLTLESIDNYFKSIVTTMDYSMPDAIDTLLVMIPVTHLATGMAKVSTSTALFSGFCSIYFLRAYIAAYNYYLVKNRRTNTKEIISNIKDSLSKKIRDYKQSNNPDTKQYRNIVIDKFSDFLSNIEYTITNNFEALSELQKVGINPLEGKMSSDSTAIKLAKIVIKRGLQFIFVYLKFLFLASIVCPSLFGLSVFIGTHIPILFPFAFGAAAAFEYFNFYMFFVEILTSFTDTINDIGDINKLKHSFSKETKNNMRTVIDQVNKFKDFIAEAEKHLNKDQKSNYDRFVKEFNSSWNKVKPYFEV